jgi:hypothetical protein
VHRGFDANVALSEAYRDNDPLGRLRRFLAGHMRIAVSC